MVGPARPLFVLFGSSIVQLSNGHGGWGAILSDLYARKVNTMFVIWFIMNSCSQILCSHSKVVVFEAQLFLFSDLLVLSNGNHYDYKDCTGILPFGFSGKTFLCWDFVSKSLQLLNPILLGLWFCCRQTYCFVVTLDGILAVLYRCLIKFFPRYNILLSAMCVSF